MLQAATIVRAFHQEGIPVASGLSVPAGANWETFLTKIDSRFSKCIVLIALQSQSFYLSYPCLKEVHKAIKSSKVKHIIPIRCAEKALLPSKDEQWPDVEMSD